MRILFLCLCFICYTNFNAQINADLSSATEAKLNEAEKQRFRAAELLLTKKKFLHAQSILDSLYVNYPDDEYINYLAGLTAVYNPLTKKEALQLIQNAFALKDLLPGYDYYAGLANERNENFDDALRFYEFYNRTQLTAERKSEIKHRIARCKTLIENKNIQIRIDNFGKPVNTVWSEFHPCLPGDESFIVFTVKEENNGNAKNSKSEDVFFSNRKSNSWSAPVQIENINSAYSDVAVCVSTDGSKLIIFRNNGEGNGDLLLSTRSGSNWTEPQKMKGINTTGWEGSASFTPDGLHLVFSSDRVGGQGGKDLWRADLLRDGSWGNVQNLGESINSKFDEDFPFFAADGLTLFFCSNNEKSLGGYDVFKSEKSAEGWSTPENIGKPLNTSHDDKYFALSADGRRVYFSAERTGGIGHQDIYVAEPVKAGTPIALIQAKGIVTKDGVPSEAEIHVKSEITHKEVAAVTFSNSISGEFLLHLPAGNDYDLIFKMSGFNDQVKHINTTFVDSFHVINVIADFFSSAPAEEQDDKKSDPSFDEKKFIAQFENATVDKLTFTVQVSTHKFSENFDYTSLIGFPELEKTSFPDKITRFTMGRFSSLKNTVRVLNEVKMKAFPYAYIIAIYKGERYTLSELSQKGVLR